MTRITLSKLAFSGRNVADAALLFGDRLNLIYGASNTGKSFAFKAIDFALGSSQPLPDNEQRRPFDRLWLSFACGGDQYTLSRGMAGGNFELSRGSFGRHANDPDHRVLRTRNDPANEDNVSQFLLGLIRLRNRQVATNLSGTKRPLSFRDLSRYCLVDETSIQSEQSPVLSGQHVTATAERSVFKLLLTGVDDSALVEVIDPRTFRASKAAKIELLDDMIGAVESELAADFPDNDGLREQDEKLEGTFEAAQAEAEAVQASVTGLLADRRRIGIEYARAEARMGEIELNVQRFAQLHQIYQSDTERLEALEEAAFVLGIGGDRDCPLCGASPEAQKHEHGLVDIERVRASATAEIAKIRQQQAELSTTVQQLYSEGRSLSVTLPNLAAQLTGVEAEIARRSPEATAARRRVSEIMAARDRVKRGLSLIEQRDGLRARKAAVETAKAAPAGDRPQSGLSSTAAHEFAQTVSKVLTAWRFPGKRHVSFDEATYDLKIDGKLRKDNGKGVRAITHAAFKVGLMLHCHERRLSHPGFLVLDTPLLTYRDPIRSRFGELEGDERELSNTPLKYHFFDFLAEYSAACQFIVLENLDPPEGVEKLAKVEVFCGEEGGGRQGLFPAI
jgi:hypothetical protein